MQHFTFRALSKAALLVFALVANGGSISNVWAQDFEPSSIRQLVLLIGNERYEHLPPIPFADATIRELANTMRVRGGFEHVHVLPTMHAPRDQSDAGSASAMLKNELALRLSQAEPNSQILFVFLGHGFADSDGKLYLAPIDFDPKKPAGTGIPVNWLRNKIADCKAKSKLLVFDAGYVTNVANQCGLADVSSQELAAPFDSLCGTSTIASCSEGECSRLWPGNRQSLFGYWLKQGMKGLSDANGDGSVSVDELYEYVRENVDYVARKLFDKPQTVVRFNGPASGARFAVARLKPIGLVTLLDDMAEQLATLNLLRSIESVGVPEFFPRARGQAREVDLGLMGRYCATELTRRLETQAKEHGADFHVVAMDEVHEALRSRGLEADDLQTMRLRGFEVQQCRPALAVGTFFRVGARELALRCRLLNTEDSTTLGVCGGIATINDREWILLGRTPGESVREDRHPFDPPTPDGPFRSYVDQLIEWLDEHSRGPHALLHRSYPYRIRIMVDDEERKPIFTGNHCYVGLRQGEKYSVRVELGEQVDESMFMHLFVNGRNTLPERSKLHGFGDELPSRWLPAQFMNPINAKSWVVRPEHNRTYTMRGFYHKTGSQAAYSEFRAGELSNELGRRQHFAEDLNCVTAAFYFPKRTRKNIALGEKRILDPPYRGPELGRLDGVVHIELVDIDALDEFVENSDRNPN